MSWLKTFVDLLFYALYLAILARIVLSWLNASPYSPLVSFIYQITDPILLPLRRIVPPLGMIDITPLLAIMLLSLVRELLVRMLSGLL
jgi:YggT family protein